VQFWVPILIPIGKYQRDGDINAFSIRIGYGHIDGFGFEIGFGFLSGTPIVHATRSPGIWNANSIICAVCFSLHNADNWSGSGNKTSVFPTVDRNLHATAISVGPADNRWLRGGGEIPPNPPRGTQKPNNEHLLKADFAASR